MQVRDHPVNMSLRAWAYIGAVLVIGLVLAGLALAQPVPVTSDWRVFGVLVTCATVAQLYTARAPGHQSYHATLIFFLAGVLLLPPPLFILLAAIPHLVEWVKERWIKSPRLRSWYLQPFNISTHIIAGTTGYTVLTVVSMSAPGRAEMAALGMLMAAFIYLILNHLLVGMAITLARRVSVRESGILDFDNLLRDGVLLLMGTSFAAVWSFHPWLIVGTLAPLVLMYQALTIPQLQKDASIDAKTSLLNARHFNLRFIAELERAKRFERPLAVIMADLDLLRNINNTYGHLVGDTVLVGVSQTIRAMIREYDFAGRFGGEEFVIALTETNSSEAVGIAERLRIAVEAMEFPIAGGQAFIHATMSLGVAAFPEDAVTATELIHQADLAVYQAKLRGRNCVAYANDVPRSIRLESPDASERMETPHAYAVVSREQGLEEPIVSLRPQIDVEGDRKTDHPTLPRSTLAPFVAAAVLGGLIVARLSLSLTPRPDPSLLLVLVLLALVAQVPEVKYLYGNSSISVAVAVSFAAALLAGIPGIVLVSAVNALVMYVQRRSRVYEVILSWANRTLAGVWPALATRLWPDSIQLANLLPLVAVGAVAAVAFYMVETGLEATAIALSDNQPILKTWLERYRWLAPHYLVLCFLGLFLALAYETLGPLGLIVFLLPILMLNFAQGQ